MSLCTQSSWYAVNYRFKDYYFKEYPWLLEFPPSYSGLLDFYIDDMKARNLTPLDSFKNCYEFLLSYGLENLPKAGKEGRFAGQTFWQRLVKDQWRNESTLWTAIKTTGGQIGNLMEWILPAILVIGLVIIFRE
jgi:hypothetical protein